MFHNNLLFPKSFASQKAAVARSNETLRRCIEGFFLVFNPLVTNIIDFTFRRLVREELSIPNDLGLKNADNNYSSYLARRIS